MAENPNSNSNSYSEDLSRFGFLPPVRPSSMMRAILKYPLPSSEITRQQTLVPRVRVPLNFPTMRIFQQESIDAYLALPPEQRRASIILPTGAGKTLAGLKIWDLLGQPDTLIVVPLIVNVMNPWLKEFKKLGIEPNSIGTYYSEDKSIRFPLTITLYKSLVENQWLLNEFQLILFDEEDILQSQSYNELLLNAKSRPALLGMTATIGEALKRNPLIEQVMPVIYERTIKEARNENILAPAEVIPIFAEFSSEEGIEYHRLHEVYVNQVRRSMMASLTPFQRETERKKAFMIKTKMLILLSNVRQKFEVAEKLLKEDRYATTLVFSSSVVNSESLKHALENKGIRAEVIKAGIPREERQPILDNLGVTYNVLISVHTLERGFDIPFATREIIVGGGTSLREAEQRVGRVLRIDPDNPEKLAKIYVLAVAGTFDDDLLKNAKHALNRISNAGRFEPDNSFSQFRLDDDQ